MAGAQERSTAAGHFIAEGAHGKISEQYSGELRQYPGKLVNNSFCTGNNVRKQATQRDKFIKNS